jgi:hypothetical protein
VWSVGVLSFSSISNASPRPRSSSTVLSLSNAPIGVVAVLRLGSEDISSRAVWNDSALDDGYVNSGGRSGVALTALAVLAARGGLGSGVGGLRALTGVLSVDFFDRSEATTLSGCGEGSRLCVDWPSCDMVGGVGGRPESAPFTAAGGSSGVGCELLKTDSVSSSARSVSSTSGAAVGMMLRYSSLRRGSFS